MAESRRAVLKGVVSGAIGLALTAAGVIPVEAQAPVAPEVDEGEKAILALHKRLEVEINLVEEANRFCSPGLQAELPVMRLNVDNNSSLLYVALRKRTQGEIGSENFSSAQAAFEFKPSESDPTSQKVTAYLSNSTEVHFSSVAPPEAEFIKETKKKEGAIFVQLAGGEVHWDKVLGASIIRDPKSSWNVFRRRFQAEGGFIPSFNPDLDPVMLNAMLTRWFSDYAALAPMWAAMPFTGQSDQGILTQDLHAPLKDLFEANVIAQYYNRDERTGRHIFGIWSREDSQDKNGEMVTKMTARQTLVSLDESSVEDPLIDHFYDINGDLQPEHIFMFPAETHKVGDQSWAVGMPFMLLQGNDSAVTPFDPQNLPSDTNNKEASQVRSVKSEFMRGLNNRDFRTFRT